MFEDIITSVKTQYEIQESENNWRDSPFEYIHYLCVDYCGKAGENALNNFLLRTKKNGLHDWEIEYQGDSNINQKDGTYDICINKKSKNMLGIKTSRIGKNSSFQHDGLHENECHAELFLDITPNYAYLTIVSFSNYSLKDKHPVFGRKPHLRKNTNNNFKFDLSENSLEKGIESEITIKIQNDTTDEEIITFIKKFIK